MKNYIYDGSFEGLLTAIYEAQYKHQRPQRIVIEENLQNDLFSENFYIATDLEKAEKVYNAIKQKISYKALQDIFYVYLSESDDLGIWVHDYLKLGWKVGNKIDLYISDDRVLKIHKIRRKVVSENHRMLGLIRFKQLEGDLYYAAIEPDYNISALLAPHFAQRLSEQNWVIHDLKRGLAVVYKENEWILTNVESYNEPDLGEIEINYQMLWKKYFHTVAISSRINPRLQKQFMPTRYWKHLVEM